MKNQSPKKKITLETIAESIGKLDVKLSERIDKLDIKIDEKIDELAISTANGFNAVNKRIDDLDEKFTRRTDNVEIRIRGMNAELSTKIAGLDNKIDDLAFHKVRDEVYSLTKRVSVLETKVGVKN
jgi:tetrahydromethanopterin S-methyltransferase subunit G